MGNGKGVLVVLCTVPTGEGERIAKTLVERRLAACVNVIPSLTSFYRWKGKMERDAEELLVIKTGAETYEALERVLKEIHPYTVPEILALEVVGGNDDYIKWVLEQTASLNPNLDEEP